MSKRVVPIDNRKGRLFEVRWWQEHGGDRPHERERVHDEPDAGPFARTDAGADAGANARADVSAFNEPVGESIGESKRKPICLAVRVPKHKSFKKSKCKPEYVAVCVAKHQSVGVAERITECESVDKPKCFA